MEVRSQNVVDLFLTTQPAYNKVLRNLASGESTMLIGYRGSGKRRVVQCALDSYMQRADVRIARISCDGEPGTGRLDFGTIANSVKRQLNSRLKAGATDARSLEALVCDIAARSKHPLVLWLVGSGRNEDGLAVLAGALHSVAKESAGIQVERRVRAIVTDDMSLQFFRNADLNSEWPCFDRIRMGGASIAQLERFLSDQLKANSPDTFARSIMDITGGHLGLVVEALESLDALDWNGSNIDWGGLRENLVRGPTIATLLRALSEDPLGIAKTALEFVEPSPTSELTSPRIQSLLRMGALHRTIGSNVRLYPGVISDAFHQLARSPGRSSRLGTTVVESGSPEFHDGPVRVDDDCAVVVHMSDLHIGKSHRWRLTWRGGQHKPGAYKLVELVDRDLRDLGLVKRINSLIVSGDLSCSGADAEFRRAAETLAALQEKLGVPPDSLVLVAGNHDVRWDPHEFAELGRTERASSEAFDAFAARLGVQQRAGCSIARIESPSARTQIVVLSLDSNAVEGPQHAGIGYVGKETLAEAERMLEEQAKAGAAHLWVVLHHHVYPVESSQESEARRRVSVTANAAEVLAYARRWGAELLLHGHAHRPQCTIARVWPGPRTHRFSNPLIVLCAGSVGVEHSALSGFGRNQYYVLHRTPDELLIRSRCIGDEGLGFAAHGDIRIPLAGSPEFGRAVE